MKQIVVFLLAVAVMANSAANEVSVPLEVYAPNTEFHELSGSMRLKLPEGWRSTEHNGTHYLIANLDVYGGATLGYSPLSIFNYSRQFGTPTPPETTVDGVTIKALDGAFARVLGNGWILRASLQSYPDFADQDASTYYQQMVEMLARAEVSLPSADNAAAADNAITISLGGESWVLRGEGWSYTDGKLEHSGGRAFRVNPVEAYPSSGMIGLFIQTTGERGEFWQRIGRPIMAYSGETGSKVMMRVSRTAERDLYAYLSSDSAIDEDGKAALLALLQTGM